MQSFDATACPRANRPRQRCFCTRLTRSRQAMVLFPGRLYQSLFIPGYEGMPELDLPDYWIDQYEVTNRQFKAFVDAGGYQKRDYWKNEFARDGKRLSWQEAMAQSKMPPDALARGLDRRPISQGQDDYPVTGISWYEAAAYAEFAGKSLPTIYHWKPCRWPNARCIMFPRATSAAAESVLPVDAKQGMGRGAPTIWLGNVKEWIWTEPESGKRYVLGGAWDEPKLYVHRSGRRSRRSCVLPISASARKVTSAGVSPESLPGAMPSPRRRPQQGKARGGRGLQCLSASTLMNTSAERNSGGPFTSGRRDDWTNRAHHLRRSLRGRARHRIPVPACERQGSVSDCAVLPTGPTR